MSPPRSPSIRHFQDANKSRVQAALSEYLQTRKGVPVEEVHQHPVMIATGRLLAGPDGGNKPAGGVDKQLEDCLKIFLEYLEALVELDLEKARDKHNEFKDLPCDLGWLGAAAAWFWHYHVRHQQPSYVVLPADEGVYPLPPGHRPGRLRVGLIADWGTGTQVSGVVLNEVFRHKPDLVLHLGDIYYAGTHHEGRNNLLRRLQAARKDNDWFVPFYNLPGNHDYYSGGEAFYDFIGQLNSGIENASTQQASYFALQNDAWQLQGMDTGYNDSDLETISSDFTFLQQSEAAWHQRHIEAAGDRKILLFSHHQLFSSLQAIGKAGGWFNPCLVSAFLEPLQSGRITGWFWGHEHLLEIYQAPTVTKLEPTAWETAAEEGTTKRLEACAKPQAAVTVQWPTGRCIGCGGFPVETVGSPYNQRPGAAVRLVKDPNDPSKNLELGTTPDGEVYNHGYAVMDLTGKKDPAGPQAQVCYYEVPGDGEPFTRGPAQGKYSLLRYQETLV